MFFVVCVRDRLVVCSSRRSIGTWGRDRDTGNSRAQLCRIFVCTMVGFWYESYVNFRR